MFVGSSSGGGLAIDYALAHPDRVEALVLVGAVVDGLGYSFRFMRRGYENFYIDAEQGIDKWINDRYAIAPGNTTARARLAELLRANPQNLSYDKVMGKGAPVVLVHGGAMDHRMWNDQFELFAKNTGLSATMSAGPASREALTGGTATTRTFGSFSII